MRSITSIGQKETVSPGSESNFPNCVIPTEAEELRLFKCIGEGLSSGKSTDQEILFPNLQNGEGIS